MSKRLKGFMRRTIILLQSGVGDLIMAIPLLRVRRNNLHKQERLLILVESVTTKRLIEHAILVDERVDIVCIGKIWSGSKFSVIRLACKLRKYRPTLFLAPHSTDRYPITVFAAIVGADTTVLPDSTLNRLLFRRTVNGDKGHKTEYYVKYGVLGGFKINENPGIKFNVPGNYIEDAKTLLVDWNPDEKWIGFAPGSGIIEAHKRWPISSYISLGKMLLDKGRDFRIAIFGSPAETYLVNVIKEGLNAFSKRSVAIINPDIMIAAGAMKHCACLVSACSGLGHLAAAVGTPLVALYGPTNPGFTGPYSNRIRIVRVGLKCSPCFRFGFNTGCGNPLCMSMIEPQLVEKEVMYALKGEFNADIPWQPTTNAIKPDSMIGRA